MTAQRTSFWVVLLLLLTTMTAWANNPDAVLGVWKNGEGTGMVQIYKKGDKYFGRVVWLKVPNDEAGKPRTDISNPDENLRSRPLKGLENLRDFVYKGDNKWEEGRVYEPKSGNDYSCEMKLVDENTLEVRGYIGVSMFGRTDVWKRQIKK
ncbi:MAG: DUF2147 domain-containing protein [Cytophagales bacterium]|nr:MAG: DUF2147 domain-containing protein [Cytophagales bacterium]